MSAKSLKKDIADFNLQLAETENQAIKNMQSTLDLLVAELENNPDFHPHVYDRQAYAHAIKSWGEPLIEAIEIAPNQESLELRVKAFQKLLLEIGTHYRSPNIAITPMTSALIFILEILREASPNFAEEHPKIISKIKSKLTQFSANIPQSEQIWFQQQANDLLVLLSLDNLEIFKTQRKLLLEKIKNHEKYIPPTIYSIERLTDLLDQQCNHIQTLRLCYLERVSGLSRILRDFIWTAVGTAILVPSVIFATITGPLIATASIIFASTALFYGAIDVAKETAHHVSTAMFGKLEPIKPMQAHSKPSFLNFLGLSAGAAGFALGIAGIITISTAGVAPLVIAASSLALTITFGIGIAIRRFRQRRQISKVQKNNNTLSEQFHMTKNSLSYDRSEEMPRAELSKTEDSTHRVIQELNPQDVKMMQEHLREELAITDTPYQEIITPLKTHPEPPKKTPEDDLNLKSENSVATPSESIPAAKEELDSENDAESEMEDKSEGIKEK